MLKQLPPCNFMRATSPKLYSELITIPTFEERFEYLKLQGEIGRATFGSHRYLNQRFYTSREWRTFRRDMIARDLGCDLGVNDGLHEIGGKIIIHHLNPIAMEDIQKHDIGILLDPENVICVSNRTHEAIHYSDESLLKTYATREPNDTVPWR